MRFVLRAFTIVAAPAVAFLLVSVVSPGELHAQVLRSRVVTLSRTDLGTLGGPDAEALAINERREIVGQSTTLDGRKHAFKLGAAGMEDLTPGTLTSAARDINERSEVAGWAEVLGLRLPTTFSAGRAWVLPLPTSSRCRWSGEVRALNDIGSMAGVGSVSGGTTCFGAAGLYWPTSFSTVVYPGYAGQAYLSDINNLGWAVGSQPNRLGASTAAAFRNGEVRLLQKPTCPGTLDNHTHASAINDAGVIVGTHTCEQRGLARWSSLDAAPAVFSIPAHWVGASPTAINAQGVSVGVTSVREASGAYSQRPFIFGTDFPTTELPLGPATSCAAFDLTDTVASRLTVVGSCKVGAATRAIKWELEFRPFVLPSTR